MSTVIYTAPPDEVIADIARQICKRLAQEDNPDYAQPEVIAGFTQFLTLLSNYQAEILTREGRNKVDEQDQ